MNRAETWWNPNTRPSPFTPAPIRRVPESHAILVVLLIEFRLLVVYDWCVVLRL